MLIYWGDFRTGELRKSNRSLMRGVSWDRFFRKWHQLHFDQMSCARSHCIFYMEKLLSKKLCPKMMTVSNKNCDLGWKSSLSSDSWVRFPCLLEWLFLDFKLWLGSPIRNNFELSTMFIKSLCSLATKKSEPGLQRQTPFICPGWTVISLPWGLVQIRFHSKTVQKN